MPRNRRAPRALLVLLVLIAACGGDESATGGEGLEFTVERDVSEATVTVAEGGTLSATAADGSKFDLVVPPNAVGGDTKMTMTPLRDVEGLGDGPVHAVQLKPEGLLLYDVARLTITPSSPIPVTNQLMFEATGKGANPGPALLDPRSEPIVLLLEHFSIGGVAPVTPEQRATFLEKSASNAERRIRGEVSARLGEVRERELTGKGDDVPVLVSDLAAEYEREVVDKRRQAAAASCTAVNAYVRTVVGFERALQLLGMSKDEEAASLQRVADAIATMQARYEECEKKAITECQDEKDPSILVRFWLSMERAPDVKRAEAICEPKGLQFEFNGSGTATDDGTAIPGGVVWHYWGLICEGSAEWKIWEDFSTEAQGASSRTGPPGNDASQPYRATFGKDGAMISITHPTFPQGQADRTQAGTTFRLSPGDKPTAVDAVLPAGDGTTIPASAPVVPADGSIEPCPQ